MNAQNSAEPQVQHMSATQLSLRNKEHGAHPVAEANAAKSLQKDVPAPGFSTDVKSEESLSLQCNRTDKSKPAVSSSIGSSNALAEVHESSSSSSFDHNTKDNAEERQLEPGKEQADREEDLSSQKTEVDTIIEKLNAANKRFQEVEQDNLLLKELHSSLKMSYEEHVKKIEEEKQKLHEQVIGQNDLCQTHTDNKKVARMIRKHNDERSTLERKQNSLSEEIGQRVKTERNLTRENENLLRDQRSHEATLKALSEIIKTLEADRRELEADRRKLEADRKGENQRGNYWKNQRREADEAYGKVLSLHKDTKAAHDKLSNELEEAKVKISQLDHDRQELEVKKNRLKEASRNWKSKFLLRDKEKADLVKQCSELIEENHRFRHQNTLEDDSVLCAKLGHLHYVLRSWCADVVDAKAADTDAHFSEFPLGPSQESFIRDLGDNEVTVLMCSIWEWMIKLVFRRETDSDDYPDLWTDDESKMALNFLERRLSEKDTETAMRWRSQTVQQLAVDGPYKAETRVDLVVERMFNWTCKSLQLDISSPNIDLINEKLRTQVVEKAIDYALDLRRQSGIFELHIPKSLGEQLRQQANQLGSVHAMLRSSKRVDPIKACVRPQLRRWTTKQDPQNRRAEIVMEAELADLYLRLFIIDDVNSMSKDDGTEEAEVD